MPVNAGVGRGAIAEHPAEATGRAQKVSNTVVPLASPLAGFVTRTNALLDGQSRWDEVLGGQDIQTKRMVGVLIFIFTRI